MSSLIKKNIYVLSGVVDDSYLATRKDSPKFCTSASKRFDLYKCIQDITSQRLILLTPPPRGQINPYDIPETTGFFYEFPQYVSKACGIKKLRFLADMLHYSSLVFKHVKTGDIIIVDNYELTYILACWYCRIHGLKNTIILEYEDGKHLIDKGPWKLVSALAECLGKSLVGGVLVASPRLVERLKPTIPSVFVPGLLQENLPNARQVDPSEEVFFIYSGSLDSARGVNLLLDYLESDCFCSNSHFHITGQGPCADRVLKVAKEHCDRVTFHGILDKEALANLNLSCHYGLNLQSSSDPVSNVTFPSKTFDYVNAGLGLVSTRAAGVEKVWGDFPIYLNEETVHSLSKSIQIACNYSNNLKDNLPLDFMPEKTKERLKVFFEALSG
jgi:hypothetical protein